MSLLGFFLLLLAFGAQQPSTAPPFARYAAERPLARAPRPPILGSRRARLFRTVLREAAAKGPNFNGHYRVASWGCGTNCLSWAIIDLKTGRVWFPQDVLVSCWSEVDTERMKIPDWFDIRKDSSLLVLHECRSAPSGKHTFDTRRLFVWRYKSLHHIRDEPLDYWKVK